MDSLMKLEIGNQMFYIKKVTEETSSGDGIIFDPPLCGIRSFTYF